RNGCRSSDCRRQLRAGDLGSDGHAGVPWGSDSMTSLKVAGLDTGYGRVQILTDVTLEAQAGSVTCIFGPNGCGKSTLLRAIAGAVDVWRGSVALAERDLTHMPSHQV